MKEIHEFGIWLRDMRKSLGLSVEDLARISGLSKSGIRQIEQGRSRNVRIDTVQMICDALGVDYTVKSKTKMKGCKGQITFFDENLSKNQFAASLQAQTNAITQNLSHYLLQPPCYRK